MPSPLASALLRRLLAAFPPDRPYPADALDAEAVPAPVAHYLRRTLQHRFDVETEPLHLARSDWFAYDHADVRAAYDRYLDALRAHLRFPAHAWEDALAQAVEQVTAYLVEPVGTLLERVYGDAETLPTAVVQRRMGYFEPYGYLRTAVERYAEQRTLHELERPRFRALLQRVDRQMVDDYDAEAWLRLLQPLFALAAAAGHDGLAPAVLRRFFAEKERPALVQRLDAVPDERLTPPALRRLLAAPVTTTAVEPPARHTPRPAPPAEEEARPESGPVPLWKQFQQGTPPSRPAPTPEPAPAAGEGQPLWMRFRPESAPPAPGAPAEPRDRLEQRVLGERGAKNRGLFVKHLFHGDADAYWHVLERLADVGAWSQASRLIADDVFKRHQVNIYNDVAVTFTEAVEARYR